MLFSLLATAQQWAGPDTATCGALGVVIGSDDQCEDCCYLWSPSSTLSCSDCKNPTATPLTTTEYSVTVVDKNLRVKGTDQVTVDIEFGEIKISPDHLLYGIDESEVHAEVTKLGDVNMASQIEWDFASPTLNCMLQPSGLDVIVTPGNLYGEVILEARKVGVQGCYVRKTIPVNNGVKDVMAVDPEHMNRVAKAGETLVVIGHEDVIIHAIPNKGGFKEGVPDWKADSYGSTTPADGSDYVSMTQAIGMDEVTSEYIAGDAPDFQPKVKVIRLPTQPTTETTITVPGLDVLLQGISDMLKFKDQPAVDPPCGQLHPFSLSLTTPTIKFNNQRVEKYNTPRTSYKKELALEVEVLCTGRLFHPVFTKSFTSRYFNVALCSRLFIEMSAGAAANIKIVKDPSLQDSLFKAVNPEFVITLTIGGGAEFAFQPVNYLAIASAKIASSAKCTFTYENEKLEARLKLSPLNAKITAKLQSISNMGEFEDLSWGVGNLSTELEIFPPKELGPYTIYNFQN